MPAPIVYGPLEMPDVEVLIDGTWWPGEVRMVTYAEDDTARHNVSYVTDAGRFVGTFTDDQIRADTIDRSSGRG